jgi:hypothetical protein
MDGAIIAFRLPHKTEALERNKFCQRFYGQDTSSGRGRYHHHKRGLLDEIPYRKLIRSVIVIRLEDVKRVTVFLGGYNAEVHVRRIRLTTEDRRILELSRK